MISPEAQKPLSQTQSTEPSASNAWDRSMSRRNFLKLVAAGSIATGLACSGIKPTKANEDSNTQNPASLSENKSTSTNPTGNGNNIENNEQEENPSFLQTAAESTLLLAGEVAGTPVAEALGIPIRLKTEDPEKSRREFMKLNLKPTLILASVIFPIGEEIIFRGIPSFVAGNSKQNPGWQIGIPFAAGFAAIHNVTSDPKTDESGFTTSRIPLPQFISGLYFWKITGERGITHAIGAHGLMNTESILGTRAYYGIKEKIKNLLLQKK